MKKKILIGSIIIIVIAGIAAVNILGSNSSSPAFGGGRVYDVRAERINKGEISSLVSTSGVIEAIEKAEVYFDDMVKINKVLVEENQSVKKGQQVVELDMESFDIELKKLEIEKRRQELLLDSGTMLSETEIMKNALNSAQRVYEDNQKSYENSVKLFEANAIPKIELESTERVLKESETALENARLNYEKTLAGISSDKKNTQLGYEAVLLNIESLKNRIGNIEDAILSPIAGIISNLNMFEGTLVSSSMPAYSVINTDIIQVRAMVNEYSIKSISEGQSVRITGDAIDENEDVAGRVKSISPMAVRNTASGAEDVVIEVIIEILSDSPNLRPGLNVTCDISVSEKENVIVIPMEAIREDSDTSKFVYVIDEEKNIMEKIYVTLGIYSDMRVEVLEGVSEGDMLILNPQPIYKDGAGVRITNQTEK